MTIDFKEIETKKVGYRINSDNVCIRNKWLENLSFGNFILPYIQESKTAEQVYHNLEKELSDLREQQDEDIKELRGQFSTLSIIEQQFLEIIATSTLKREALMNSMELIEKNYLD